MNSGSGLWSAPAADGTNQRTADYPRSKQPPSFCSLERPRVPQRGFFCWNVRRHSTTESPSSSGRVFSPPKLGDLYNRAQSLMFQHDRTCCVCRQRELAVQIHHVDENPTNHAISNLGVLCLEHHEQTQTRGGFAKQLKAADVIRNRDDWICRVRVRRDKADELVIQYSAGMAPAQLEVEDWNIPSTAKVIGYLNALPSVRKAAIVAAEPLWDTGITSEMRQGCYDAISLLESAWLRLANCYPPKHFGGKAADHFFFEFIVARFDWHRKLCEPRGPGSSGTMVHLTAGGGVLDDVAKAIEETVEGLYIGYFLNPFDLRQWRRDWEAAGRREEMQEDAPKPAPKSE
jgi:hypothetical protein